MQMVATDSSGHRNDRNLSNGRTDISVVKDSISDAGGPRFESQAGRVTGKSIPSLWRDKHPAIKSLWPPEHHAGKLCQVQQDLKTPSNQTKMINAIMRLSNVDVEMETSH